MQSGPQELFLQRQSSPQRQLGLQAQPSALDVLKRGALLIFVSVDQALLGVPLGHAIPRARTAKPLERNGYDISSAAAGKPNMRLNVRLRCAESEKPASWAASVSVLPAMRASTARTRRSQST